MSSTALAAPVRVGEVLAETPLFDMITSAADLARLAVIARLRLCEEGTVVAEQGSDLAEISVILRGRVTVSFAGGEVRSLALAPAASSGRWSSSSAQPASGPSAPPPTSTWWWSPTWTSVSSRATTPSPTCSSTTASSGPCSRSTAF